MSFDVHIRIFNVTLKDLQYAEHDMHLLHVITLLELF